jgi:hypothetical protein
MKKRVCAPTASNPSPTSYEEILQTTIREIGNSLRDTEISIQITDEAPQDQQDG